MKVYNSLKMLVWWAIWNVRVFYNKGPPCPASGCVDQGESKALGVCEGKIFG